MTRRTIIQHKAQRGVAIISVMCFIMVLTALATVAARSVGTHVQIAADQVDLETAFFAAEAGLECGASYVSNDGKVPHSFQVQVGEGRCFVTLAGKATAGTGSGTSVIGLININPNGKSNFRFSLSRPGGTITQNDLKATFGGYVGSATFLSIRPKGGGTQNGLSVDQETYVIDNDTTHTISSSTMSVSLFNEDVNGQGRAVGTWYIAVGASDATITPPP